jgi:osmotically-inducible protein OsmY
MTSTKRAASAIAAIAMIFAVAACADDDVDVTSDTAAGTVGTAATQTPANVGEAEDRVEVALSTDTALRVFALDADDDDNRIVLRGTVRTEELRTLAAQIAAREASGIPIDNRIRVVVTSGGSSAQQPVDIDEVEERVEDALAAEAVLKPFKFNADEEAGQLVVEGTVQTAEQKALAEQIARRVAGTVTVVSRIRVQ